jgi:hypothetical protein
MYNEFVVFSLLMMLLLAISVVNGWSSFARMTKTSAPRKVFTQENRRNRDQKFRYDFHQAQHQTFVHLMQSVNILNDSDVTHTSDFGTAMPEALPEWKRIGLAKEEDLALGVDPKDVLFYVGT